RFLDLERRHRSVILGLMRGPGARAQGTSGARFGLFATLRRGLSSLVDAVAELLPRDAIRTGTRALAIERVSTVPGDRQAAGAAAPRAGRAPGGKRAARRWNRRRPARSSRRRPPR